MSHEDGARPDIAFREGDRGARSASAQAPITVRYLHRRPFAQRNFSVERYFATIRQHLPRHVRAEVVELRWESRGIWRRALSLLQAATLRGGIVHVTGDVTYVALALKRGATILTLLDCGFANRSSALRRSILRALWYRIPVRRASIVTVISEFTRRELVAHVPGAGPKTVVVPVCVSPAFRPRPKAFNVNCPTVLLVGTAPNKNLERSFRALAGLPCRVRVIGRLGPEHERLLSELEIAYESSSNLSDGAIIRAYEEADIVLFASTYEGFGMPIVEAQRVGRPVVTSNVAAMPDTAGDGALLVNPYDVTAIREAVQRVISDGELRGRLVARGFANAERFSADSIAAMYADLYHRIAEGHGLQAQRPALARESGAAKGRGQPCGTPTDARRSQCEGGSGEPHPAKCPIVAE